MNAKGGTISLIPIFLFALFLAPTKLNFLRELLFPPALLFLTPALVIGFFIFIFIIGRVVSQWKFPPIPKQLFVPYAGFLFLILLSLTFTPDPDYGLSKAGQFFALTSLACFAPFFLFNDSRNIKWFFYSMLAMGIFLALIAFVSLPYSKKTELYILLGSNYLLIQHISGMAGLIIIYYFLVRKGFEIYTIGWFFLLVIIIGAMLYSGGKAPVFTFLMTTIFMSVSSIRLRKPLRGILWSKRIFWFPFIVCGIGLIVLTALVSFEGFSLLLGRFETLFTIGHYSFVERLENAKIAMGLLAQHPVLGVGIGGFSTFSFEMEGVERFKYPHNIILEVLSELGLVGFLIFMVMVVFSFKNLLNLENLYKDSYIPGVFISLFVYTFLNSLTSQDISNPALFAFIGASFAIEKVLKDREGA